MLAAGFLLATLALAGPADPAADDARAVPPPHLRAGDELAYAGEVVEASERFDNRFRKRYDLEVRLLVLEVGPAHADGALLTRLRPRLDPAIAGPAAAVLGTDAARQPPPPTVRVDLVRIDGRGRVSLLVPTAAAPKGLGAVLDLTRHVAAVPLVPLPLDGPPVAEAGFCVPLPLRAAAVGTGWDAADADRPPVAWSAHADGLWNGGRVLEVRGLQQSEGFDRPRDTRNGWRRTERVLVSPADGTACRVERRVERRQGTVTIGWVEATYELQPGTRLTGGRFAHQAREAQAAYLLGVELTALLARRAPPAEYKSRAVRVKQFLEDHPAGSFREAVQCAERRYLAAAAGEPLTVAVVAAGPRPPPPRLGGVAPDFVAPCVPDVRQARLSALRGRPCVLAFYRPDSKTSAGALAVAEALHRHAAGRATVLAVAVLEDPAAAERQRAELKLTVPLLDGRAIAGLYGIDSYPKFFALDAAGALAWQFDGFGPETGFLAREQLDRLAPPPPPTPGANP